MISLEKLDITPRQLKGKPFVEQKKLFQDAIKWLRAQNIHRFQPQEYRKALIDYLRFLYLSCANKEPDKEIIANLSIESIQEWVTRIVVATEENERDSDGVVQEMNERASLVLVKW